MDSAFILLLAGYATAIFATSLLGGMLAAKVTLTHRRIQLVISFVSGLLLGVALFHLLLHSLEKIPDSLAVGGVVLGIIMIFLLLRFFQSHSHDLSHEEITMSGEHNPPDSDLNPRSVFGVVVGLAVHTIADGIALGASVSAGQTQDGGTFVLAGLGVFLAVFLHKPIDSYSIIGLMRALGYRSRVCTLANVGFALLCPLVAVLTVIGVGYLSPSNEGQIVGFIMAVAAGVFLCISLSNLLPEVQFHSHDRGLYALAFFGGVGLAYASLLIEIEAGAVHTHVLEAINAF